MGKVKTNSKLSSKQHPVLAYLPDGWEFAIIAIKPSKGYKNTENKAMRCSSAQPEHPWAAARRSWVPKELAAL